MDTSKEKLYEIWAEGYSCTGQSSGAMLKGIVEASSFLEACRKLFKNDDYYSEERIYQNLTTGKFFTKKEDPHYWGCKLFDNETEARKSFG